MSYISIVNFMVLKLQQSLTISKFYGTLATVYLATALILVQEAFWNVNIDQKYGPYKLNAESAFRRSLFFC